MNLKSNKSNNKLLYLPLSTRKRMNHILECVQAITILLPTKEKRGGSTFWLITTSNMEPTISINITPSTKICTLLHLISNNLNCKPYQFNLLKVTQSQSTIIDLALLNGNDRLIDHGVTFKTPLYLKWRKLTLYIKTFRETVKLTDISWGDDERDILWKYGKIGGLNMWDLHATLTYNNKPLHGTDSKLLSLYPCLYETNITNNAYLNLSCSVTIVIPNKDNMDIDVDRTSTISDLKQHVHSQQNIELYAFTIRQLRVLHIWFKYIKHNNKNKDSDRVFESMPLEFEWKSTTIFIRTSALNNEEMLSSYKTINDINFNDSIQTIKSKYSQLIGISHTLYQLFYDGQLLQDDETIHTQKLPPNAQLQLVYEVIVIVPNHDPIMLDITPFAIIKDLKMRICVKMNLNENEFKLYTVPNMNDEYLSDTAILKEYNIKDQDILYLVYLLEPETDDMRIMRNISMRQIPNWICDSVKISVQTIQGRAIELKAIKLYDTVLQIKLLIQKEIRIYHALQGLIYDGHELDDKFTLKQLRIDNGDILYVVIVNGIHLHEVLIDDVVQIIDYNDKSEYDECEQIKTLFNNTSHVNDVYIKMEQIYKIKQNYKQNRMIFEGLLTLKKNKNEAMLFHGTSLETVRRIICCGFNRDYNQRSLYGKGTYFSNITHMAAAYSQQRSDNEDEEIYVMLCCRTYIGSCTIGKYAMMESDLYKSDKVTQYDSFVDNLDNPTIFVINRDYHSIPYYLIVFSIHSFIE